jgi:hypothetical protein
MATNRRIGKYLPPSNTSQSGIWEKEDLYASPQGAVVQNGLQFYIDPARSASYSGSGSTAYDLSGNSKNATLVNSPTITGSAFTFLPGNNSYISCGNFGSFYAQGTISFWMNSTDVSNYRNPIHSIYQGSNAGFRFEQAGATGSSGTMGMLFGTDAGVSTGHQLGTFSSDTWYLITVTWNTSTNVAVGYVNGSQVFSESNTTWPTTLPSLTLGGGFSSSAERWYSGGIGAVMLYNKVLSATEVAQNYAALKGRYGSISTTIPSAPTVGTVSAAGNTTVSIPYTDNGTGGRYVQGHYATVTPSISATVTSQASPLTLTGPFAAGTAYSFKVSGYNQNGYSTLSTSSNTVTYNVPATMSAPTVSGTSTTLQVSYTAPNNNNSAITGYTVTSSGFGSLVLTSAATANPLTYSASFTQGQAYSFTIAATNYYGTGTASPSSNTITPYPSTVPDAPTIGTATATGTTTATVTFSFSGSNHGAAIDYYAVNVFDTSGNYITGTTYAGSPASITGLTAGTSYKFAAYAHNANGYSVASSFTNNITTTQNKVSTINYVAASGGGVGGTGGSGGGGGGGGGATIRTTASVSAGSSYTITVGGQGSTTQTTFGTSLSSGGGGGAGASQSNYGTGSTYGGGGGGGASNANQTVYGGTTTNNGTYSYSGGTAYWYQGYGQSGAGGGGVTGGGGPNSYGTSTSYGGNGYNGYQIPVLTSIYAGAGGGGGAVFSGGTATAGVGSQSGTSGNGGNNTSSASSGAYGGGGGGGGYFTSAGAGGTGIVCIWYSNTYPTLTSTSGSPTFYNSGGNYIYVWQGNGGFTV